MLVDREFLEATLRNLRLQEQQGLEMVYMARGAIQVTEAMVARLSDPDPEPKKDTEESE